MEERDSKCYKCWQISKVDEFQLIEMLIFCKKIVQDTQSRFKVQVNYICRGKKIIGVKSVATLRDCYLRGELSASADLHPASSRMQMRHCEPSDQNL